PIPSRASSRPRGTRPIRPARGGRFGREARARGSRCGGCAAPPRGARAGRSSPSAHGGAPTGARAARRRTSDTTAGGSATGRRRGEAGRSRPPLLSFGAGGHKLRPAARILIPGPRMSSGPARRSPPNRVRSGRKQHSGERPGRRGSPGLIGGLGERAPGSFSSTVGFVSDAPAYVPLARKWRPRTFADVVGQDEIVRALTNAVSADRLAHAYLFSGPRGVGKTTTARLLAAAINCTASDRPTATPCGACASCVEVLEGRSLDTLEIDGATHGKVDQARDLIEIVAYAPSRDRRKVFIIDEVHAISSAAFQALLKTLEEPPSHAVFILATTERHKIPATILSRCQRFDFRRLTDDEVAGRLADIAGREGFEIVDGGREAKGRKPVVERAALAALAAAATGSLRDGLSLFDQAASRSGGGVTAGDVSALLGAPDRTALVALLGAVLASDRIGVFKGCAELEAAGAEPRATLHDLTALVRGAVRLAAAPAAPPPTGLSEEGAERVREFARLTPYATLLRLLSLL